MLSTLTGCVGSLPTNYPYPAPFAALPYGGCQIYTDEIVIDGTPQTAYGHICPQPDGTWRVLRPAVIPPAASLGSAAPSGPRCVEHIGPCDGSCDNHGILGARHIHADCSRTCDLICADREGYAPWGE
ncbi:MAG TPA: hypothetical protein VGU20_20910 [Stellaceae bacterium]|nr:hypothetical protein [Stellaceae bacterium]